MAQKKPQFTKRKLALPLRFKVGSDGLIDDGFFVLTKKDVSEIIVESQDSDGYFVCKLFEPEAIKKPAPSITSAELTFIGAEPSTHRGQGKETIQYKYFERPDGYLVAEISGKRNRRLHLGSPKDQTSKISKALRIIAQHFQVGVQFDRKELMVHLPKNLTYGQILKSVLDVLKIKGYLEKHEKQYRGRPYERYSPTNRILEVIPLGMSKWVSSEQAQNG